MPTIYIEGIEIKRCPLTYLSQTEIDRLSIYKGFKAGFLPNAGGWIDQPMKFANIVGIIESELKRLEDQKNA